MAVRVIDQNGRQHWFHDPPELVIERLVKRITQLESENYELMIRERLSSNRLERLTQTSGQPAV
jgi:hypothetical protein